VTGREPGDTPPWPTDPVEIAAGRLQLRPWESIDAPAVLAAAHDPAIGRWNPAVGVSDLDGARAWCARRADWSAGDHASWAVKEPTTGALLGSVSLSHLDPVHRSGEIGYWTLPEARGHGVATGAVRAAARFGFGALALVRLELFHAVENTTSCRVAEGAGFGLEGVHRRSHRYGDGLLHDEHCHARLADDPDPG
jgi:RimJ/RimL family protein N-acetyltransferase